MSVLIREVVPLSEDPLLEVQLYNYTNLNTVFRCTYTQQGTVMPSGITSMKMLT